MAQLSVNQRFALFYPGEAPVLPRGHRPLRDADPGRVHADDHGAELGRARDGQARGHVVHGARHRGQGGGSVILPGPNGSDFADQDFRSFVGGRPRAARVRQLLREPARRRPRGRGRRVQPGHRPGLRVRARRPATRSGARSSSARPRRRTGPTSPPEWDGRKLSGHAADVTASHSDANVRHRRRVQGLREGVPRRRRLRPAGRIPRGLLRDGLHVLAEERADQPPQDLPDRRLPGRDGRAR